MQYTVKYVIIGMCSYLEIPLIPKSSISQTAHLAAKIPQRLDHTYVLSAHNLYCLPSRTGCFNCTRGREDDRP